MVSWDSIDGCIVYVVERIVMRCYDNKIGEVMLRLWAFSGVNPAMDR